MSLLWHFLCIFCTVSNYNWANILNICRNRGRQSIFLPPKKTSTFIECKTWRGHQREKLNWPHNGCDNENDTSPRKSPFHHWVDSLGPKYSLPKSFRALCSSFWCWVKKCHPGSWLNLLQILPSDSGRQWQRNGCKIKKLFMQLLNWISAPTVS